MDAGRINHILKLEKALFLYHELNMSQVEYVSEYVIRYKTRNYRQK